MRRNSATLAVSIPVLIILIAAICACGSSSGSGHSEPLSCDEPCHALPPSSGAHLAHVQAFGAAAQSISCVVCHGLGASAGIHPGHRDAEVTLLGNPDYPGQHGTLPSWFGSTWGGAAFHGAPSSIEYGTIGYGCANLRCHGGGTVGWDEQADSPYYNRVCLDCHDITPAEFALPGDPATYRACNAAANYEGPISGWGRGGHGDTTINNWSDNPAPGSSLIVPMPCVRCHDDGAAHFPPSSENPYRVWRIALQNGLPGADAQESRITNLCTQTDCHPKTEGGGDYAFLTGPPKHPNDYFRKASQTDPTIITVPLGEAVTKPIHAESASCSVATPAYDPAAVAPSIGLHIDRFVDHWAWWDPSTPATAATGDNRPFLPLGDSLSKAADGAYDNGPAIVVTCITCHNPHGTDLAMMGKTPMEPDDQAMVPDNKMLRLRDSDNELCEACH